MRNNRKTVVFDLDSTLCDCTHRHHYVKCANPDFDTFHSLCNLDDVNEPVRFALDCYAQKGYNVIILTGRPIQYIDLTVDWLVDNMIEYDQLLMKRDCDPRGDVDYKRHIISKLIKQYNIVAVFEDRKKIVDMFRDEFNLTVFDVAGNLY